MNTTSTGAANARSPSAIDWFRGLVAPLLSLICAIAGQWLISAPEPDYLAGGVSYALSLGFFMTILIGWPASQLIPAPVPPVFPILRPVTRSIGTRLILLMGTIVLSTAAFFGFANNSLLGGLWPWLGAILLFLLAFAELPASGEVGMAASARAWWQRVDKRALIILLAIILLSTFFRFYRLAEVPAEMTSDHAEKLLDVQDVLDGLRPIFFPRNTGREAMQFYLTALLIKATPLDLGHLALKVGTGIIGVVAIPFTFLLARLLYGNPTGLLAAFFMAISHWHVAITRVGLRFPFTAAFATPALYFLLRAFKSNRRNDWLAAALFLGIGLHTYTAMRIVPLLFVILIALRLLMDGWQLWRRRPLPTFNSWRIDFVENVLLGGFFTVLLFLPLARVIVDDPQAFWLRMASRTQSAAQPPLRELVLLFIDNVQNALLMFNVKGDVVVVNTIPGSPVLGPISAALFVLGIAYLLWRVIPHFDRRAIYVLTSLFVLLLPSILSLAYPQENPSVVRTGGAIPWVMLTIAIPLTLILQRLAGLPAIGGKAAAGLVVTGLAVAALLYNYNWYFVRYDAIIRRSLWNSSEMGQVMREFVDSGGLPENVYHVPYPHWVDSRNIGINAGYIHWANTVSEETWLGNQNDTPGAKLYLLFPGDTRNLRRLVFLFPRGELAIYDSPWEGKDFLMVRVP